MVWKDHCHCHWCTLMMEGLNWAKNIIKYKRYAKYMLSYKRQAPIQKTCSYTKDILQYKRYAQIQKIPSITKYMHLQTDKEMSYLPVSTRRPRQRLRSDPCKYCLERRPFYSMFISNKFYGAKQTEDLENRICRTNNGRQLLTFI